MIIVTNAIKNWVYKSAKTLLPLTYKLLKTEIDVISARDQCSEGYED